MSIRQRWVAVPFNTRRFHGRRQLRQRIEHLSHEVAVLEEVASQQPVAESAPDAFKSVQQIRASLLQTDPAEKETQLASLVAQEEALGPEKTGGTDWVARRTRRVRTAATGTVARIGLRGLMLVLVLLAVVVIAPAVLLRVPVNDVLGFKAEAPGVAMEEVLVVGELAPAIHEPVGEPGERFFTRTLSVPYSDGRIFLSGQPYPSDFAVDDRLEIIVTRPDGSTATWTRTFNDDCLINRSIPPQDITDLLAPGDNSVTVALRDICGATRGTSGPLVLSTRR